MKLGIDIGGTFTDLVLLDEQTGQLHFGKTLTTYDDPSNGIIKGMTELLERVGVGPSQLTTIVHGTTLVTNAVIERRGALTGLITTKGFEDVLEIGRELRYDIYDLHIAMPEPLVPRSLRKGITERINYKGEVITPIKEAEIAQVVDELVKAGVQSIAVCFLHSFVNPVHEKAVGEYIKKHHSNIYVSLSCQIMPEIREYERTSATAMNAYVQPITDQYLANLENRLRQMGFRGTVHIMVSSGKLTTVEGARQNPIQLLESGPAGGAMAGVFYGKLMNQPNLIAFDMGGTTAKTCLINHYQPEITNQFEAARVRRFKKGSGLPVRIPVIDLIEIGAGGGSIAYIDALGLLKVGPESAASEPGPACYGRGGTRPTVTDCDLVLGYLNPTYFLGGKMPLDLQAARTAIEMHLARPLGITVEEAAMGVHRIVNENMANAARVHILEKGRDPRHYAMLAFGGAGPVHAFQVARLLNVPRLIIPVGAGVVSALGFLVSPVASEQIRSWVCPIKEINWQQLNDLLAEMEEEGMRFVEKAGFNRACAQIARLADMRYSGQGHEIAVSMPNGRLSEESIPEIYHRFTEAYRQRYGRSIDDIGIEVVTWRVIVSVPSPSLQPRQAVETRGMQALKGYRTVYFMEENKPVARQCPVYNRYMLQPGDNLQGPAVIEEMESTTIVGSHASAYVDDFRNIVIDLLECSFNDARN
ncbi:MAG: hydantoinase/oxoprolinase family protein [Cytophagales bacterium]|nr:hydantoinase/oxoprolinase family protein [Bernardetiaceae bacterium]MDW8210246.1 hydantoinase/oxoprolinase family protein [Cytophagales bacterium]